MADEKNMIDKLIEFFHHRVGPVELKNCPERSSRNSANIVLAKLQATAEDLNNTSDYLC